MRGKKLQALNCYTNYVCTLRELHSQSEVEINVWCTIQMDKYQASICSMLRITGRHQPQLTQRMHLSPGEFMMQLLACKKVLDKRVKGHVTAWCATKLYESQKLTSTICIPLKSLSNGSAHLIIVAIKDGGNK